MLHMIRQVVIMIAIFFLFSKSLTPFILKLSLSKLYHVPILTTSTPGNKQLLFDEIYTIDSIDFSKGY